MSYRNFTHQPSYYCPNCGQRRVFVCNDDGDYGIMRTHICDNCLVKFNLGPMDMADQPEAANNRRVWLAGGWIPDKEKA